MRENNQEILRSREVCRRTGLSRVTLWRLERANSFPKRRQLSRNAVGWIAEEIDEWIATRRTVTTESTSREPKGAPAGSRKRDGRQQRQGRE